MACANAVAKKITNDCNVIPRSGYEAEAYAINRTEIDVITYDATYDTLIEGLTLLGGEVAFKVTAVKKEMNGGFDLVTGDDIPDSFNHYFAFKPYEADAASVANLDDMNDLVIVTELKGQKAEGCFVIYGLEKGLYKSAGTQRGNDGFGLPIYEMASLEGQGERYSRFSFWITDYATTKAYLEALLT